MESAIRLPRRTDAFTLIELMIVVIIVAILATIQLPMYRVNVTAARMSEGVAGAGTIRTGLRVYFATHGGNYPVYSHVDATSLSAIGVLPTDLDGRFFRATSYIVNSSAKAYTIQATLLPTGETYIMDQNGVESGSYQTGQ